MLATTMLVLILVLAHAAVTIRVPPMESAGRPAFFRWIPKPGDLVRKPDRLVSALVSLCPESSTGAIRNAVRGPP
jgi:hypothetical protein